MLDLYFILYYNNILYIIFNNVNIFQQDKVVCHLYLKFKENCHNLLRIKNYNSAESEVQKRLKKIVVNDEENYRILKVSNIIKFTIHKFSERTCFHSNINIFNDLQITRLACNQDNGCFYERIVGLFLQSIVMATMPSGKLCLELGFGTSMNSTHAYKKITISGIIQCKILNWWSNDYPYHAD